MNFYYYILIIVGLFTISRVLSNTPKFRLPSIPNFFSWALILFVIGSVAFSPIERYGDKYNYLIQFQDAASNIYYFQKDLGWSVYNYLTRIIFDSSTLFFLITASIYVLGYYFFSRKYFPQQYAFVFLFACFASFGFLSYGINTLRAGFSLSLLLLALSYSKKRSLFIIFSVFAILSHITMALPIGAFVLTKFYNKPSFYLRLWVLAFLISLFNIEVISGFVQANLLNFDERSGQYFSNSNTLQYKIGFRIDFVIYSVVPILIGFFFINKQKVKSLFYNRMLNVYLFTNAFWILNIRMSFSDRMAYLSWFLIPFILLFPPLNYKLTIPVKTYVGLVLLGIISFSALMHFIS